MEETVQKIIAKLGEKYVFHEKIVDTMMYNILHGNNFLIHSKAGHAKTEMVQDLLKSMNLSYKLVMVTKESNMYNMFGFKQVTTTFEGVETKEMKLTFDGYDKDIIIFDEWQNFTIPLLSALNQILLNKEYSGAGDNISFPWKCVIFLGNEDKKGYLNSIPFAQNNSNEASLERIKTQHQLVWANYDQASFIKLLDKVVPDGDVVFNTTLAMFAARIHRQGGYISPRAIAQIARTAHSTTSGTKVNALRGTELDDYLDEFKRELDKVKEVTSTHKKVSEAVAEVRRFIDSYTVSSLLGKEELIYLCGKLLSELKVIKKRVGDKGYGDDTAKIISNLEDYLQLRTQTLQELVVINTNNLDVYVSNVFSRI